MKTLNYILFGVLTVIAIDFLGFIAWAFSGQIPVDGFYVGAITKNVLQVLFF